MIPIPVAEISDIQPWPDGDLWGFALPVVLLRMLSGAALWIREGFEKTSWLSRGERRTQAVGKK